MKAINPTTEEAIAEYPDHTQQQVEQLLEQAESGFAKWRGFSFDQRGELLRRVGELLLEQKSDLSVLMTREMGKTIAGAEAEVEKCASACDYFANHAQRLLAIEEVPTDATRSYVRFDPLGPILAIMPWNFPFWQVFRFAAPSLMAGNVAVLKHAWNVPGCGLAIERIFREAGFPQGVFTNLLLDNNAAEALIAHPRIRAVTLTGSERAGKAVGSAAGRVIKKSPRARSKKESGYFHSNKKRPMPKRHGPFAKSECSSGELVKTPACLPRRRTVHGGFSPSTLRYVLYTPGSLHRS